MELIKAEYVRSYTFDIREEATLEILDCIENLCNKVRIHSTLGNLNPEKLEARHVEETAAPA